MEIFMFVLPEPEAAVGCGGDWGDYVTRVQLRPAPEIRRKAFFAAEIFRLKSRGHSRPIATAAVVRRYFSSMQARSHSSLGAGRADWMRFTISRAMRTKSSCSSC